MTIRNCYAQKKSLICKIYETTKTDFKACYFACELHYIDKSSAQVWDKGGMGFIVMWECLNCFVFVTYTAQKYSFLHL